MKLVRYGAKGREKPGIVDAGGNIRDLSGKLDDITPDVLAPKTLARLARLKVEKLPLVKGKKRLGVPFTGFQKFIGVGLNYSDHAAEINMPAPDQPIIFTKHLSCLSGPNDDVVLPKSSKKADWEVELGVVIGSKAKNVTKKAALDHVAGYCLVNDISEREWQIEHGGQWVKGKSADTFGPVGPWLVTADEIANVQRLSLFMELNGKTMQNGTTNNMIFGVAHLVSHLSKYMTLLPGDLITTGTPAGVGMGRKPQRFLRKGDIMRLGLEGMGEQMQKVTRAK